MLLVIDGPVIDIVRHPVMRDAGSQKMSAAVRRACTARRVCAPYTRVRKYKSARGFDYAPDLSLTTQRASGNASARYGPN